jgi:hypothetical protein
MILQVGVQPQSARLFASNSSGAHGGAALLLPGLGCPAQPVRVNTTGNLPVHQ